jgi:DNA replication protein DnaC
MASNLQTQAERAAQLKTSYSGYLGRLVEEELLTRTERSTNYRIKSAHLPYLKTVEGFNYGLQPTLNQTLVRELAELGFLGQAENVVLMVPPGVGKTHLPTRLGDKPCAAHKRIRLYPAMQLLDQLVAAQATRRLIERGETGTQY